MRTEEHCIKVSIFHLKLNSVGLIENMSLAAERREVHVNEYTFTKASHDWFETELSSDWLLQMGGTDKSGERCIFI